MGGALQIQIEDQRTMCQVKSCPNVGHNIFPIMKIEVGELLPFRIRVAELCPQNCNPVKKTPTPF